MIKITAQPFGVASDESEIVRFTLVNDNGMQVNILSYACAVQSILVPDKDGIHRDVVLGYDRAEYYEKGTCYFGAFVGRYANRIKDASFSLNGKTYELEQNDGHNHLHGSFSHRNYHGEIVDDSVVFSFVSPPSEEGYPGTLTGKVRYRLTEDNALEIEYSASCDEDTVINLTNHSYFNLNGQDGSDVLDHTLVISADRFTEIDEAMLPTGHILSVDGTPLDFRREKEIGANIFDPDPQLKFAAGYDHNLILNGTAVKLKEIAKASSQKTGIILTAFTTEPGVQLYTGNFIQEDAAPHGKDGVRYPRFGGFCLEAQHYPCSPNFPEFPSAVLAKEEVYRQKTIYQFSVN